MSHCFVPPDEHYIIVLCHGIIRNIFFDIFKQILDPSISYIKLACFSGHSYSWLASRCHLGCQTFCNLGSTSVLVIPRLYCLYIMGCYDAVLLSQKAPLLSGVLISSHLNVNQVFAIWQPWAVYYSLVPLGPSRLGVTKLWPRVCVCVPDSIKMWI